MTQTPEDEWFGPDDSGSPAPEPRQPAGDSAPFDLSALDNDRALAVVGAILIGVIALVAAGLALADSTPLGHQTIPIASAPIRPPAVSHTTLPRQTTPTVSPPTTTLKPGDTGAQVKALQRELNALGYTVGKVDGSYGSQTSKAVTAFQRARHLTADGIVGPLTLQALAP